jgi:hypothetical protein
MNGRNWAFSTLDGEATSPISPALIATPACAVSRMGKLDGSKNLARGRDF